MPSDSALVRNKPEPPVSRRIRLPSYSIWKESPHSPFSCPKPILSVRTVTLIFPDPGLPDVIKLFVIRLPICIDERKFSKSSPKDSKQWNYCVKRKFSVVEIYEYIIIFNYRNQSVDFECQWGQYQQTDAKSSPKGLDNKIVNILYIFVSLCGIMHVMPRYDILMALAHEFEQDHRKRGDSQ